MHFFTEFILLIAISTSISKDVYKCASDLNLDTCHLKHEIKEEGKEPITTYYVKPCPKGKICHEREPDFGGENYKVSQCEKVNYLLLEGEKCESPAECHSQMCVDHKCHALNDGEACTTELEQCKLGSYCGGYGGEEMCRKYALKGEACDVSLCRPGLECYEDKCIELYTLENGKEGSTSDSCISGNSYSTEDPTSPSRCGVVLEVGECPTPTGMAEVKMDFGGDTPSIMHCYCERNDYPYCDDLRNDIKLQPILEDYIKAYKKHIDDILNDEKYFKIYLTYFDTFGIKELKEKYIEYNYAKEIAAAATEEEKDCVRDYFIRQLSSGGLFVNLFGIFLLILVLI